MNRNGWTYTTMGDCFKMYQPKTIAAKLLPKDGQYLVYGANGVIGKYNEFNHEEEQVILGCRGTCGSVTISKPFSWINGNAMVIKPKDGFTIDQHFLAYLLKSLDYSKIVTGIAQPQITRQSLIPVPIAFPTIKVQLSIVEELEEINLVITRIQQQVKDLDTLAQSLFYDMFGDPYTNNKGFNVIRLGDICSAQNGLVDPREAPYCDMYHIGPANIVSHTGDIVDLKISKNENLISGKYLFDVGMVLYSKIRPNLNKVAKANFMGICSADMYPLIPKENITTEYLYFVLRSNKFLEYAVLNSGRANIPKINREALFAYETLLPPLSIQKSFDSKIAKVEESKASLNAQIKEMQGLLASRMQYWFD